MESKIEENPIYGLIEYNDKMWREYTDSAEKRAKETGTHYDFYNDDIHREFAQVHSMLMTQLVNTQPQTEEKECECCKWDDMGYTHEPYCPLFKEYKQDTPEQKEEWEEGFNRYWGCMFECGDYEKLIGDIKNLLSERERKAEKNLLKRFYNVTSKEEFRDVLDKLNKKK